MNTIHISIRAYNAEKTLRRAIDSVLAQTYKNYKIYVCDNGSTDGTRAIVSEYAEKHGITAFYNEENYVWTKETKRFANLFDYIPEDDFFAILDADDELFPDFFEELVKFALDNDLDFASANFIMENAETGETALNNSTVTEDMIFDSPEKWDRYYRDYYLWFRQCWGKIYRTNVAKMLKNFETSLAHEISDTIYFLTSLLAAKRVGAYCKPLMRYFVSRNSVANSFHDTRKKFPEVIFNALCNFIDQKAGYLSSENLTFVYRYYCAEFREVLRIHLWIDIPLETKLDEIDYLFSTEKCRDLYAQVDYFEVARNKNKAFDLFDQPLEWIFANLKTLPPERVLKLYYLFFDVIYQSKPIKFTEEEIRFMLSASVPLANSLLLGIFDNANVVFTRLPDSDIKRAVMGKVEGLK
jgi:glycosyltransferase involved in cell wall biosynthesis